ncbi:hypothetical protein CHELA20_51708 [Hyphomicrobiales bacterium]|nr:hypothetical protein CHELA20_51708 [Hyphomicrobiales bacterium]
MESTRAMSAGKSGARAASTSAVMLEPRPEMKTAVLRREGVDGSVIFDVMVFRSWSQSVGRRLAPLVGTALAVKHSKPLWCHSGRGPGLAPGIENRCGFEGERGADRASCGQGIGSGFRALR